VFEPYWSGSGGQGTGLGLYITKRIVEAHQGEIWIDSIQGQGTNVHFTLKRAPAAS
jgi:signal transduction histidine kinase